jgi:hypothetical protein
VLLVLAGFASVSVFFTAPGVPALALGVFAVLAWRRGSFDRCRQLTTIGWAVFAGIVLLQIVVTVLDAGTP